MSNSFTIKPAAAKDIPLILKFIQELAEYENLSSEVVATEELLEKNLFGEHNTRMTDKSLDNLARTK